VPHERFVGPDVPRLLDRVRAELGEDAVVLEVRELSGPGAARFEVIAAAGEEPCDTAAATRPLRAVTQAVLGGMTPPAWIYEQRRDGHPPVFALVGPTGAGKTTTLAKLANHRDVFGTRRVGLLCLDTYRVGGVEQLRLYADLSGVPVEVAYDEDDLGRALRRMGDCEVILADTAGRGPRRREDLERLGAHLRALRPVETHLVLPAGLQPMFARRQLVAHRALGVTHVIASKLDECPGDRTVAEVAAAAGLPMRWATDGQEVPRDLRDARDARLERRAAGEEVFA